MNALLIEAAENIDRSLKAAELASVEASIRSAKLVLTMLEQHDAAGAPSPVMLEAIRHATKAASLSVEAREAHIRAHGALNVDVKRVGLEERFSKDSDPPYADTDTRWVLPRGSDVNTTIG